MGREFRSDVIVLKTGAVGENHRGATLLARDRGLIRVLAYGARGTKSALRGALQPFVRGTAGLYHDPVKDLWRLNTLDVTGDAGAPAADLDAFYEASLWAEVVLHSHAGGDDPALFDLLDGSLERLTRPPGGPARNRARYAAACTVQFLWRWLAGEGVGPDPGVCGVCGRPLDPGEVTASRPDGLLACPDCAADGDVPIPAAARRWLMMTGEGPPEEALKVGPDEGALKALRVWLCRQTEAVLERPLKTLKAAGGAR